jgi:S1-C subfamily serine protease
MTRISGKRRPLTALSAVVIAAAAVGAYALALASASLLSREMASTVMVGVGAAGEKGHGSGVAVGPDLILTAAHVTKGEDSFLITLEDGRTYPGTVLWESPARDTALVKLTAGADGAAPNMPSASLACRKPVLDEDVTLIGNQQEARFRVSRGKVASTHLPDFGEGGPDGQMGRGLILNVAAGHGDSGGPVFDTDGHVIALLEGGTSPGGDYPVVWGIPSKDICELFGLPLNN